MYFDRRGTVAHYQDGRFHSVQRETRDLLDELITQVKLRIDFHYIRLIIIKIKTLDVARNVAWKLV